MDSKKLSDIKKKREEEDEKVQELRKYIKSDEFGLKEKESLSSERILQELESFEHLIIQVDSLYRQFMAGVESKPPYEQQKKLQEKIAALQGASKPTTAIRFRFGALQSRLLTYQDRWAKLLKDLETGKKKRPILKK